MFRLQIKYGLILISDGIGQESGNVAGNSSICSPLIPNVTPVQVPALSKKNVFMRLLRRQRETNRTLDPGNIPQGKTTVDKAVLGVDPKKDRTGKFPVLAFYDEF